MRAWGRRRNVGAWLAAVAWSAAQRRPLLAIVRPALRPSGARAKSGKSALVVIPPLDRWDSIQAIRRVNDKMFYRWMPHINVLHPFYEDRGASLEEAALEASQALEGLAPFTVLLGQPMYFNHGPRSSTLWLDPTVGEPVASAFQALHAKALAAFPDCTELSADIKRNITRFVPHVSLGWWPGAVAAGRAAEAVGKSWQPINFDVRSVYLISRREFDDPFQVRWEIPIGGGKPKELNLRYAASLATADGSIGPAGGSTRDVWKQPADRPAFRWARQLDMGGLPWGLFPEVAK